MEMVRQRETTIKKLESRTRNALEISIKADDGNAKTKSKLEVIFSYSRQLGKNGKVAKRKRIVTAAAAAKTVVRTGANRETGWSGKWHRN